MTKPTLLTIAHDPAGQLVGPLDSITPSLSLLFSRIVADVTIESSPDLTAAFGRLGARILLQPANGMAAARRSVLAQGVIASKGPFFYCDLDRLVYWYLHFPSELATAIDLATPYDFTIYGRTRWAFDTHPVYQRLTETGGNALFERTYGQPFDVLAGTRGLSYRMAQHLIKYSIAEDAGQDIEWCLMARDEGFKTGYIEVNGLAYESEYLGMARDQAAEKKLRDKNLDAITNYLKEYRGWHV